MYKCFVSFEREHKRHWKMWRADSISAAATQLNLIAAESLITYVRFERV